MKKIKKFLDLIWDEFIYGGHLLSLGALSTVFVSAILLEIKVSWYLLFVIYLGSQAFYFHSRLKEIRSDALSDPQKTKHIQKYIKYIHLIIFFFCFLLVVILIYFNKIFFLIPFSLIFFIGILYTEFFKKITKKIIAFKNIIASLVGGLLALLPGIIQSYPYFLNLSILLVVIFFCLRWFLNSCFLDIKDIRSDQRDDLLTLPLLLNKEDLFNFLFFINILAVVPIIYGFYLGLLPFSSLMLLFTIPYTFFYLKTIKTRETKSRFLNYVFVEGEFVAWVILLLFGKIFL